MARLTFLVLVLFLVFAQMVYCRVIKTVSSDLVSDGVDDHVVITSTVTCEPMYGFLPCTTTLWGKIFLIVVYQYLLFLGESYISAGTELTFRILGPGIFGASAFHILGAFPEAIIVLVSGVYGSKEAAQLQVVNGMGLLAGSSTLLLTLLWGTCVIVGNSDISTASTSLGVQDNKRSFLTGFGVTTDHETNYTARIMVMSTIPFIIAQLPHMFGASSQPGLAIIISLLITLALLLIYCIYQVFQPWIQNKRLEFLMHKYIKNNLLNILLTEDGKPHIPVMRELFRKADLDLDKYISRHELRGIILGIQFEEVGLNDEDFVEKLMTEFDSSGDAHIDEEEFIRGLSKWIFETKEKHDKKHNHHSWNLLRNSSQKKGEETEALMDHGDKDVQSIDIPFSTYIKAASLLLLGISMLAILAAPLIETVADFSTGANIPSILISFVMVPMVVNYREAVSAISSIRNKKPQSASLTFSEIYSAVFMNNVIGLSIFLTIVYARGLAWDFSAEVLVVLIICMVMGLFTSFKDTFPLWTSFVAYLLYPLSLLLLYVLTMKIGWA